ncbi:MAG TPA: NADH-quinone oxidoreductase subunit C [Novimethylophilus sp.]|jgi:Ni,Fe-hydrogenase III large subunit/Ni,Fe-hydrogenase III component G|uniref:hydrogenase large subunit n=1 Tax=Novimethylophilus sp. TaxID=2137426 RepID=UPI002F3F1756
MDNPDFPVPLVALPGAMPAWHGMAAASQLHVACEKVRSNGGRLIALWGSDERQQGAGFALHVALADQPGLICLTLPLPAQNPAYPAIDALFPAANRMQRATYDLLGIVAQGADDSRQWLRHGSWPQDVFPLRKDCDFTASHPRTADGYPFVSVSGSGVHEIAVGPVHAGTIEPGHFRFSVVGERVLRLEERLGYAHKGIEKLAETMSVAQGAKLAGRISGDSTVAFAWAYAMAAESIAGSTPPPHALWLRALLLERERIANHLGDLGYLGNDVALSFGFAQFWRLKEEWLRTQHDLFGHRYLMDCIVPGGVAVGLAPGHYDRLRNEADALERQVRLLKDIYDEHAGAQDRFLTTGRVTPALAAQLGLAGLAGRASGLAWDLRAQFPIAPYDQLEVRMATHRNGDVAARVLLRFEEIFESLRLIRQMLERMPGGETLTELPQLPDHGFGLGWVEGWRGEALIGLHTGVDGMIQRLHPHDPSWQNWPLLEHAVIGNIVPDFPLINKSFNLSYSGQDL